MSAELLDVGLAVLLVMVTLTGWHRGLLVSASSLVGTVAGVLVARAALQNLPNPLNPPSLSRISVYVLVGFLTVSLCSALGGYVGRRLRRVLRWRPLRRVDEAAGAVFSLVAWSIVVWVAATALIATPFKSVPSIVSESRAVNYLDTYMPASVRDGVDRLRTAVSESSLPTSITSALSGPVVDVPDISVAKTREVRAALGSVVRVEGTSSACAMRMTGSGFVGAAGLVVTNAHVVAGADHVSVRVKGTGKLYRSRVIYWDKDMDVAVLRVPGLGAAPLTLGKAAPRGTAAVIAGFPGGGRLTLVPAGVRSVSKAAGTDIYGDGAVKREIYALLADIKQGDSGAPVLALDGTVIGMVFASSATDKTTGYALTPAAFQGVTSLKPKSATVSTGTCVSD